MISRTARVAMRSRHVVYAAALLYVVIAAASSARGDVFSIDFGADSMKLAVVSQGHVLEVATNEESRRSTPSKVAYVYPGEGVLSSVSEVERGVSSVATRLDARFPHCTFVRAKQVLGALDIGDENDMAQAPVVKVADVGSGDYAFESCNGTIVSAEEVIAYVYNMK